MYNSNFQRLLYITQKSQYPKKTISCLYNNKCDKLDTKRKENNISTLYLLKNNSFGRSVSYDKSTAINTGTVRDLIGQFNDKTTTPYK